MPQWEYQVIHLNVAGDPPQPAASGAAPAAAGSPAPNPKPAQVFSQEYLQKEFPGFYTPNPTSQQHPALQLQTFLNGVGQKGWSLIGVFPLGPLLMMIFRRRLVAEAPGAEPPATPTPPDQPGPPPAGGSPTDLEALLQRLAAIEKRLDHPAGT
ncbi:MAG: hypothetical protein WCQ20_01905 [Synechococcaceae cyanobacterium ELA739]